MSDFPVCGTLVYLVGFRDPCGRFDQYFGVFVDLQNARDCFRALARTDKTAFLCKVKVQR